MSMKSINNSNELEAQGDSNGWGWDESALLEGDNISSKPLEEVVIDKKAQRAIDLKYSNPQPNVAKKGIPSSPSFQELEKAIGDTLALGVDTDSSIAAYSPMKANSPMTYKPSHMSNYGSKPSTIQRTNKGRASIPAKQFPQVTVKEELAAFINEPESRALILFHSPSVTPMSIRDACQKFGVLYYIRPEFHAKGVTFLCYYDIRNAIEAHSSLPKEFGGSSDDFAVYYSLMLHTTNNNIEEGRLSIINLNENTSENDLFAILKRYGEIRSIQQNVSDNPDESIHKKSFTIEYFNIQDTRSAVSELFTQSSQFWNPSTSIAFSPLSPQKQELCRQLLSILSKWRSDISQQANFNRGPPYFPNGAPMNQPGFVGNYYFIGNNSDASGLTMPSQAGFFNNQNSFPMLVPSIVPYSDNLVVNPPMPNSPNFVHLNPYHRGVQIINPIGTMGYQSQSPVFMSGSREVPMPMPFEQEQNSSSSRRNHSQSKPLHHSSNDSNAVRKTKNSTNLDSEYLIDISKLEGDSETRTTVMVRNIPNKYTQKMLLDEVNCNHSGTYDFFYLPIDFKNKCNVGYCFINFLEPKFILNFINEFNGQRWKNFNSEKVCAITFARIQGKAAMISRFQNSSLLEKNDEYRPLLFISQGPDRGKPEAFPTNVRSSNQNIDDISKSDSLYRSDETK